MNKNIVRHSVVKNLLRSALVLLFCVASNAGNVSKPYNFTSGTSISASQTNANFDSVFSQIGVLSTNNKGTAFLGTNMYLDNNDARFCANASSTLSGAGIQIPGDGMPNQNSIQFWTTPVASVSANAPYATATPRMMINAAGNVGIGTTAPSAALDVNGDIKVSGRIYGTGIPAYGYAYSTSAFTPPTSMVTTSGSSNEVPGLAVTLTTHGGDLEIRASVNISWKSNGARGAFSSSIDGKWVGFYMSPQWNGGVWGSWFDGIIGMLNSNWDTKVYRRIVPNIPAGTHTVKLLAWNESGGGLIISECCSMANLLVVKELLKQN